MNLGECSTGMRNSRYAITWGQALEYRSYGFRVSGCFCLVLLLQVVGSMGFPGRTTPDEGERKARAETIGPV